MHGTKKIYWLTAFCTLVAVLMGCRFWLISESQKVHWVVELVGGAENLRASEASLSESDALYIKSLYLSPDEQMYNRIRALNLCQDMNDACVTTSLTVANFLMINTADVQAARNTVEQYARYNVLQAQPCPAKYETSVVIKNNEYLSTLPMADAKRFAEQQLEKIEASGGLVFSLRTPECHRYFAAHPSMARGYLAHMALLVRAAQGKRSAAWLYLLSRPGVYAIIK
ncbi:hypothetical protein J3P89_15095 [Pseudomonas sp. Z1-14]|uniref:hypothetical protein n=1 Tax=Pseudomonas TaxID=286 RepID=UPI002160C5C4|nr:hypothetical protein [Pseudomonas brassicacearum]UVM46801.1 hypothetical protein LOY47_11210 [Pseudomonas brassicacearum]